jgi:hypothetical protein
MIVIPKQFYVGFRSQGKDSPLPLAFLTSHDDHNTKAFEKRKDTVDRWASGSYWIKAKKIKSQVAENTLLEGYKIAEDIRRVYWGGGNVVWRMIDPRGWEFEISSSNLARILDCATIVKGVIQGKCILGRDKAQNVLLPENSEPYQEAVNNTTRAAKKLNVKDVKPGDTVVLKSGMKGVYLGVYYVASSAHYTKHSRSYPATEPTVREFANVKKRHFIETTMSEDIKNVYDVKKGAIVYIASADIHISEITHAATQPLDMEKTAHKITASLQGNHSRFDNLNDAYLVSDKPLAGRLSLKAVDYSWHDFEFAEKQRGRRPYAIFTPYGQGSMSISKNEYYGSAATVEYHVVTIDLTTLLRDHTIEYVGGGVQRQWKHLDGGSLTKIVAELDGKQYEIRSY